MYVAPIMEFGMGTDWLTGFPLRFGVGIPGFDWCGNDLFLRHGAMSLERRSIPLRVADQRMIYYS